jgi:hypothetical protein
MDFIDTLIRLAGIGGFKEICDEKDCSGDFNRDKDLDGRLLALFAGDFESDGNGNDLTIFAADFGKTECP